MLYRKTVTAFFILNSEPNLTAMLPLVRLRPVLLILLALQQYAGTVSGSVNEFQCACGYNAANHARTVHAKLTDGGDAAVAAAVELAADYGSLVKRILFVVSSRPEPTAQWLWLFDLYANGVRRQLTVAGSQNRHAEWLARAVDYISRELKWYLSICRARGVSVDGGPPWWDQGLFEKYILENVTAVIQRSDPKYGAAHEDDFAPRWLYLNDVAPDDDTLRNHGVMPDGVGVDWGSTAVQLSVVYSAAVRKWVFGTRELVAYQKKFIAIVAATLMGHVLVHVEHCRTHRLLAMDHPAADDVDGIEVSGGPVGEYELMWMSVGALLDKYKSYLALGPEKYYRALVRVAANPAHDDRGFRDARHVIQTHMANVGAGLFGPAATNWTAAAAVTPQTLIDLIALVDNNISAAEKYLKNVRDLLSNVDFRIVNKFMRSTHIWLL